MGDKERSQVVTIQFEFEFDFYGRDEQAKKVVRTVLKGIRLMVGSSARVLYYRHLDDSGVGRWYDPHQEGDEELNAVEDAGHGGLGKEPEGQAG